MTDVTTPVSAPAEARTAAVTDLQAYRRQRATRQTAQQLTASHFPSTHDGWSLSAFHPFAAAARTNLR